MSVVRARTLSWRPECRSSIQMKRLLLGSIGEGGDLDSANLSLVELLLFDLVGVDICLLGGRGILHISGQLDALVVIALVAVLSDLSVGLGVEVFGLDGRDVAHIPGHMGVDSTCASLLLLCGFVGRDIAHVSDDGGLLALHVNHLLSDKLQIFYYRKQNVITVPREDESTRRIMDGVSLSGGGLGQALGLQYFIEQGRITMDIDFILFTPPKIKYSLVDFWGETIFIPRMRKRDKNENSLASFLNCYKASATNEVHLTIDAALLQAKGTLDLDAESMTEATSSLEEEEIQKHIPCLFLNSMVGSRYLIFYLHASGQDIRLSYKMLDYLRNLYQVNVLAMQYCGYSIYKGTTSSDTIKDDSLYVYNHMVNRLGFKQQNIIVMGRSIGTGVALQLMKKTNPGALVLISPFSSIKSLAREVAGFFGHWLAKQSYDNKVSIQAVTCPTFFLHGRKDDIISADNTADLARLCVAKKQVLISPEMTHSTFDFYSDLADPLRQFLMPNHFNFYEPNQQGPVVADSYFQFPPGIKL